METRTASIAVEPVMPMPVPREPDDYNTRLSHYRTSLSVFKGLVKNGILTDRDYDKMCTVLADKYGISLCSIFS